MTGGIWLHLRFVGAQPYPKRSRRRMRRWWVMNDLAWIVLACVLGTPTAIFLSVVAFGLAVKVGDRWL